MDPFRLGYFYLSPPGSTKYRHGIRGYDVDVFRSLAQSTGGRVEFVETRSNGTVPYEEECRVLGQIENGSLFTFLDLNSLTPIRAKTFEMVLNRVDTVELVGGVTKTGSDEEASLSAFVVFAPLRSPSPLSLSCSFNYRCSRRIHFVRTPFRLIPNFFLIYGVFLAVMFHGAGFQGNTWFPPRLPVRNLQYYLPDMRAGRIDLIALHYATVKLDDVRAIAIFYNSDLAPIKPRDPNRLIVEPDHAKVAVILCSPDRKYLAVLPSSDLDLLPKQECAMYKVDTSVLDGGKLKMHDLLTVKSSGFLLRKQIPKRILKKLNWLYNSFYGWDNRQGLLYRRYLSHISLSATTIIANAKILPTFTPFKLTRMSPVLYMFAGLIAICCIVAILEIFVAPFIMRRLCSQFSNILPFPV